MPGEALPTDEMTIERLGEKLRAIRKRAGFTLDQMAACLGKTAKARRSRVLEWETGHRTPNLVTILRYARFAGISTDILLDDTLDLPPAEDQN
jgi:transcriptional regulator with XRE-family HTH domain